MFAIVSFVLFSLKITILYRYYVSIPDNLILAYVLPAFNNFTALGFHRKFYKNYITHEPGNVRLNYKIYTSLLFSWFILVILILSLILYFKNSSLIEIYLSIIIITTDRVLDEVLRINFFRKKVKKWTLISAVKTFVPL